MQLYNNVFLYMETYTYTCHFVHVFDDTYCYTLPANVTTL